MGHGGEINADQAHRGYYVTTHDDGLASVNPLYMSYLPGPDGHFNGHHGYGYKSLDVFVNSCIAVNEGSTKLEDLHNRIPTLKACIVTTAILEAGRASLDGKGKRMTFTYDSEGTISGYE